MSRPLTIKMVENDVPPHRLVILAAEGQATFCVCKVVLATRSPVFGSMLNLPHAAFEARGMVGAEDIPIIAVDERAKYMEPFLRAISDSNYFRPPQMHFYDVLAILKLSNKYQTWDLSRIALRHLETIYAVDLSQVHRRPQHSPTLGYYPQSLQYHFKAIQILEGVGAKWLLPAAYYAAASTFHTEIWRRDSSGSTYPPWAAIWETCVELVPFLESSTHRNYNTLLERSLCAFPSQCDQMKFSVGDGSWRTFATVVLRAPEHDVTLFGQRYGRNCPRDVISGTGTLC
ncbi:hypothetical protein C8R46DRAFT_1229654 [Mycena filopes]|nr:hypothetical protein C8R46DRAFT_1229654 [Mycena filopes]